MSDQERERWVGFGEHLAEISDGERYVYWAYRLLLGREPDLREVQENPFKGDRPGLVQSMLASDEFRSANPTVAAQRFAAPLEDEFDITDLRVRSKRRTNIARLGRSTRAVAVANGNILCTTLGKYKQYVSQADSGFSPFVLMDGFYEYFITEFVARNVREGMTVIDIGANYGYYTLLMADLVGDAGRVYAFEPNPLAAEALAASLRVNGFDRRVAIDRRAIWDAGGDIIKFHVPAAAATNARVVWPLDGRLPASDPGIPDAGEMTIETVALDDLPLGNVAFIKADIEGAEERLWHGSKNFLRRNPDLTLLLEFNASRCEDAQATLRDMAAIFPLRYLDGQSIVKPVEIADILNNAGDWMLVLSDKQYID